jgi:hypothetical protein
MERVRHAGWAEVGRRGLLENSGEHGGVVEGVVRAVLLDAVAVSQGG